MVAAIVVVPEGLDLIAVQCAQRAGVVQLAQLAAHQIVRAIQLTVRARRESSRIKIGILLWVGLLLIARLLIKVSRLLVVVQWA